MLTVVREKDYPYCVVALCDLSEVPFLVDNPRCLDVACIKKRGVAHETRHDLKPVCLIHVSLVPYSVGPRQKTLHLFSFTAEICCVYSTLSGKTIKVQSHDLICAQ